MQEKSLSWLLEMDLDEPEEKLFALSDNEYHDEGLSEYEAEVAGRPMFRGNAASDDLATYVDEEIVISSDNERSDIYADKRDEPAEDVSGAESGEAMAIDYSQRGHQANSEATSLVDDGSDILGLSTDDDIGEKFLTIKRVKASHQVQEEDAAAEAAPGEQPQAADKPVTSMQSEAPVAEVDDSNETDIFSASSDELSAPGLLDGFDESEWPSVESFAEDDNAEAEITAHFDIDVESAVEGENEIESEAEVDGPTSNLLSEAPVPCLVAEPGTYAVANEEPAESGASDADDSDGNVLDYVAAKLPPADDAGFDAYLLGGVHLNDADADPEELTVQRTEGIVSVDPSSEPDIDYHEDFRAMEGFGDSSVTAITSVIALVMEEISGRARKRMGELGFAADTLEVDVMLGTDQESIKRCYAEGFEPVTAICDDLPLALNDLGNTERDALYVRLFHGQTNENWNDLFSSEFIVPSERQDALEEADPVVSEVVNEETAEVWLAEPGLSGDVLDGDFSQEFDLPGSDPGAMDIDAMFDDLLDEEVSDEADAPTAPETVETVETPESAGFGEDIFSGDFAVEMSAVLPDDHEMADIESAFSNLSAPDKHSDEICGVDVDEFENADQSGDLPAANATGVAEEADNSVPVTSGTAWFIPEGISFNFANQGNAEIFADFLDAFIEEGSAEVEKLEEAIGEWEKDVTLEAVFASVTRTLHTIKGIAKGVGLQRYGTLIHNFETLLEAVPRPQAGEEQGYFRMINTWLDAAVRGIEFVQEQRADIASEFPVPGGELPVEVESVIADGGQDAAVEPVATAAEAPGVEQNSAATARQKKRDQQLADEGAKALAAQQSVRITSEKLDHLLNLASQAQQLGVRSAQSTSRNKRASAELQGRLTSVRSHIAKIADRALLNANARGGRSAPDLDALEMDQYSELQEAASILREGVEDLADLVDLTSRQNALVEALLKQQSSVISSISSSIQAARVVPVSRMMPALRRIVRTVSTDLDKAVSFKVLNETGALDRDHYARCQVILEHMVRNALDHGIEAPEDRLAVGKPTAGRITIDVRKSGGDYIIRLADDGKGIDPDAIRESAYEKGMDVDVDALSDEEALRLIFHKGFSTASTLSEISGRGVGMDIVISELQQIGGDIQIQSTVGLGTSFEVRIPSNVTVNGALLVAAGDNSYAIPLNGLIAVEHVSVDDFYNAVERSETLSLFDMECAPAYLATLCQGDSLPERSVWGTTVPVIIAGSDERHMAIAIDNVEEALELVVRSLGAQFSSVPGVAGAATTAEGEAIVALDLNLLVGSVVSGGIAPVAVSRPKDTTLLALVVDDSRTQRMVATNQLDTVGIETVTAENGQVAIDLLNSTHRLPDIVLLDVEMPVKDGIETLREIRKSLRYGHLPVIMVTSRTGAKHRALAKDAGCNGYMGKPFNFPALIEQISDLTGHDLQLS